MTQPIEEAMAEFGDFMSTTDPMISKKRYVEIVDLRMLLLDVKEKLMSNTQVESRKAAIAMIEAREKTWGKKNDIV